MTGSGVVEVKRFCNLWPGLEFAGLIEHAEHLARHNPSPAQWTEAYQLMRATLEYPREKWPTWVGERIQRNLG